MVQNGVAAHEHVVVVGPPSEPGLEAAWPGLGEYRGYFKSTVQSFVLLQHTATGLCWQVYSSLLVIEESS